MYIILYCSLVSTPKDKLLSSKHIIGQNGPTLLWVILKSYQGTVAQVIRVTMTEFNTLPVILKDTHQYNVKSFAVMAWSYLPHSRMRGCGMGVGAGGGFANIWKKYEALRGPSCADFNNNLVVWRSMQEQTGTTLDVWELLDKAKMDYHCQFVSILFNHLIVLYLMHRDHVIQSSITC